MTSRRRNQQGFSIVMAVFIIVVLGMLAAAMLKILATGADTVAREIVSARALMAAESGAQRKLNDIFTPGAAVDTTACNAVAVNYAFPGLQACSNAAVLVSCNFVTVDTVNYFTIRSEGRCGPVGDQAVRVVEVQARDGF